jgi:hypothetical protein
MKPEQQEIERLRRDGQQTQGGAGYFKRPQPLREGSDMKFVHCEAPEMSGRWHGYAMQRRVLEPVSMFGAELLSP